MADQEVKLSGNRGLNFMRWMIGCSLLMVMGGVGTCVLVVGGVTAIGVGATIEGLEALEGYNAAVKQASQEFRSKGYDLENDEYSWAGLDDDVRAEFEKRVKGNHRGEQERSFIGWEVSRVTHRSNGRRFAPPLIATALCRHASITNVIGTRTDPALTLPRFGGHRT